MGRSLPKVPGVTIATLEDAGRLQILVWLYLKSPGDYDNHMCGRAGRRWGTAAVTLVASRAAHPGAPTTAHPWRLRVAFKMLGDHRYVYWSLYRLLSPLGAPSSTLDI